MNIKENLSNIKSQIKLATDIPVTIVAVTKNRSADEIISVIDAGITNIGENRWQEAKEKIFNIPSSATKHFIGHLQTNKVKDVVRHFDVIQSVDRVNLAKKISNECIKLDRTIDVMIQVNTSNEPQKSGISPGKALGLIRKVSRLPNINIVGLMTIGVMSDNENEVRDCFRLLKQLFDQIKNQNSKITNLSMGMSGDYRIAIEEGANMVRIGRGLFG